MQKVRGNVLDLTAQDLLGKSHEELVLLLIHLRRQAASLGEAIDGSRAELENITNSCVNGSDGDSLENKRLLDDLHLHVRELEEKRARVQPIINLVDNMVKLGSLYRGPADGIMSHRIRNLPSSGNATSNGSPNTNVSKQNKDEIQVTTMHILYSITMFVMVLRILDLGEGDIRTIAHNMPRCHIFVYIYTTGNEVVCVHFTHHD